MPRLCTLPVRTEIQRMSACSYPTDVSNHCFSAISIAAAVAFYLNPSLNAGSRHGGLRRCDRARRLAMRVADDGRTRILVRTRYGPSVARPRSELSNPSSSVVSMKLGTRSQTPSSIGE
jgi:hypothetical protein